MGKKVIVFNAARCQGCKTCVVQCAMVHSSADTPAEAVINEAPLQARVHVEAVGDTAIPIQCRQCDDAPCILVCPKEALHRPTPDGPVLLDSELCGGCNLCILACPYGVIDVSVEGKAVVKCDLCFERTETGMLPECVESCPLGGLQVVEVDGDLENRHRRLAERVADNHMKRIQAAKPRDGKVAYCDVCGANMGPIKQLEFVRSKLPDHIPVAMVCRRCRRSEAAAALAEIRDG
jgi:carbon-monoxide dehydrogenase iron sulfur subunit